MPASIDAFLEQNPLLIKIGKRLIVDCLKQYELPNRLFPPNDPGWYKTLIHAIDAPHVDELVKQPLTIITFNYDRSLDCFLHQWIQHRYKLDTDNAAQTLNELGIIHVHGTLGKYPFVPYSTEYTTTIDAMCDDIKIVHELAGDDTTFANQQFLDGHHKLQQAERIYFLGFGFHPDNIRRFKFFNTTNTASIEMVATNQMGEPNEKFMERMAGYGMEKMRRPHCNCHTFFLPQHATLD